MARYEDLPYRTCVGMMLINAAGLVFIGRRAGGIEHVDDSHVWQMPQGGVDPGEDTWAAAKRELYEETSVRSVEKLGEVADWLIYDIPRTVAGRAWKGRYRGQRQKWFAVRFTGEDSEINVASPGGGHKAEFVSWRWEPMKNLPDLIVPFKRPVYERVVKEFSKLAGDWRLSCARPRIKSERLLDDRCARCKPYRPNVGVALFNAAGRVLIGRRFKDDGPEIILPGLEWQMPQGGIDADENPREAVMRELWEETGAMQRRLSRRNRLADLRISALRRPAVASAGEIPRPAPEMVRAALYRARRRDRSADTAQRPAGGIRPMALGAARPRRRSRGAVPARGLSDGGAVLCALRAMNRT